MAENTLRFTKNFVKRVDHESNNDRVLLLNPTSLIQPFVERLQNYDIGESFYLESLVCSVVVPSLGICPVPDIAPEDTNSEKQKKWYESTSRYPRIGMKLWQLNQDEINGDWEEITELLLQNRGIPSKLSLVRPVMTMANVELMGRGDQLAVSFTDKGFGKLGIGDYLIFRAAYRIELDLIPHQLAPIGAIENFSQNVGTGTPQLLRSAVNSRKLFYCSNTGDNPAYLLFADQQPLADPGTGIYLHPEGGAFSFEPDRFTINKSIYIYSVGGSSQVSGMEGYTI